jgi:GGDEF domain-containing protein
MGERFRVLIPASPFTFRESVLAVTCSIGCATQPEGMSWDEDSMIRLADEALYDARTAPQPYGVSPARTRGVLGGSDVAQTL